MNIFESIFTAAELPYYLSPLLFVLMGFRHGLDADHVAALGDLIIMEKEKRSQVRQGILYASGHSLVVLVMGFLAALIGFQLSKEHSAWMEFAVGVTLFLLGSMIFIASIVNKEFTYRGRIQLIVRAIEKLSGGHLFQGKDHSHSGSAGIFLIGIIHGIGAETPTQLALITSSAGLGDGFLILIQIVLFTAGVLVSTVFLVYTLSWGVNRLQKRDTIFKILGWLTGAYSIILGTILIRGSEVF